MAKKYTADLIVATTFSGSLIGTVDSSSYASTAYSSSYALTASYALNSSGGGSSTPTFPYTGSAIISGSLQVTGSINSLLIGAGASSINSNTASIAMLTGSLISNTTGVRNVALGSGSLALNTTGTQNVAIGNATLNKNTTGASNIAIGTNALTKNTTGSANIALGISTLANITTGSANIALGINSLTSLSSGSSNIALGSNSLSSTSVGTGSVVIGINAGSSGLFHHDSILIGQFAGFFLGKLGGQAPVISNIAIGKNSQYGYNANSSRPIFGYHNISLGEASLYSGGVTGYNIALGHNSQYSNTYGNYNISMGHASLYSNYSGSNNLAIGSQSLYSNTTGSNNIAQGPQSLYFNTSGSHNIAIGSQSLYSNTTGNNNLAIGPQALYSNTTGSNNIAIGPESGKDIELTSNNIVIGKSVSGSGFLYTPTGSLILSKNIDNNTTSNPGVSNFYPHIYSPGNISLTPSANTSILYIDPTIYAAFFMEYVIMGSHKPSFDPKSYMRTGTLTGMILNSTGGGGFEMVDNIATGFTLNPYNPQSVDPPFFRFNNITDPNRVEVYVECPYDVNESPFAINFTVRLIARPTIEIPLS